MCKLLVREWNSNVFGNILIGNGSFCQGLVAFKKPLKLIALNLFNDLRCP